MDIKYLRMKPHFLFLLCFAQTMTAQVVKMTNTSYWPQGKQAAVSFTFDDASFSQVDSALPLLNQYGVKASFYISIWSSTQRLEGWKSAIKMGHEIGNHTNKHPCAGSYGRDLNLTLEEYTLKRMKKDIQLANKKINDLYNIIPATFAYPCGQKYVGSGQNTRSYVPIIAKHFIAGRSYMDEGANDPNRCDLAKVLGVSMDNKSMIDLLPYLKEAEEKGLWLVLVGHHVGTQDYLTTDMSTLKELIQYFQQANHNFWIAPFGEVAKHILRSRSGS